MYLVVMTSKATLAIMDQEEEEEEEEAVFEVESLAPPHDGDHPRDLIKDFQSCAKQSDHMKYIPFTQICLESFPRRYRIPEVLEAVRIIGKLTVLLNVTRSSSERPKYVPNKKTPYPFFNPSGQRGDMRNGTGLIVRVEGFDDDNFRRVVIRTATHFVFDDHEARDMTVTLFYDGFRQTHFLYGHRMRYKDIKLDCSEIECLTMDLGLGDKLKEILIEKEEILRIIHNFDFGLPNASRLAVIPSHPHGLQKFVGIGYWRKKRWIDEFQTVYAYDTPTCPGCSGAPVWLVGVQTLHQGCDHFHSKFSGGLNWSGVGREITK